MISATKTFTSIKGTYRMTRKKYYQLLQQRSPEFPRIAVLRLMMDQTHGCIHSQGTAEDGYPQKPVAFWDTPTMLLSSVFVADCQNDSNQIDENQIVYKPYLMAFLLKKCHTGGSTGCSTPHCIHSTDNNVAHFAAQNEVCRICLGMWFLPRRRPSSFESS